MPARESEALVLRTYPYREADLIVSFLSRDYGKLRGIARGVRRPKSRFGAGLERLSHARIHFFQKQTVELVRVDRSELLSPPLVTRADYGASLGLDYVAEITDEVLPDHEPNDAFFRLIVLTLDAFWSGFESSVTNGVSPGWLWQALTYFGLWSLRLSGWLPPLDVCIETGKALPPGAPAWFGRAHSGLLSADRKPRDSWLLTPESRALAGEMLRYSLPQLPERHWTDATAADLRRFVNQRLEAEIERRLKTLPLLDQLTREPR